MTIPSPPPSEFMTQCSARIPPPLSESSSFRDQGGTGTPASRQLSSPFRLSRSGKPPGMASVREQLESDITRLEAELLAHLEQRLAGDTSENWALILELRNLRTFRDQLVEAGPAPDNE